MSVSVTTSPNEVIEGVKSIVAEVTSQDPAGLNIDEQLEIMLPGDLDFTLSRIFNRINGEWGTRLRVEDLYHRVEADDNPDKPMTLRDIIELVTEEIEF